MDSLLSYSLHDLLIFSPDSFFKLFELSNKALWPFHIPLVLLAVVAVFLLYKGHRYAPRFILMWLAFFWCFVGYWYFSQFYKQINTYAHIGSYLFYAEAGLLMLYAVFSNHDVQAQEKKWQRLIGGVFILYGFLIHPILSILMWGQPLIRLELFSIAPDPTAISTIGFLLLLLTVRDFLLLMVIPCIWLIVSIMTYLTF